MIPTLRLGTRASALAMIQAEMARAALIHAFPELEAPGRILLQPMSTSGDANKTMPLYEIGGKGLFVKEIEEALLGRTIDIAVHSLKDVPGFLPSGLTIGAVLPREDARDTLISPHAARIADLPENSIFGTSSPRRAAQMRMQRPDLIIQPLRGNVPTRLAKIERGEAAATLLAVAGLKRLGITDINHTPLSIDEMLPALAQGTIALECREEDPEIRALLEQISHPKTMIETEAERAFLATLDGSCRTPIAGYAEITDSKLHFRGLVAAMDGSECYRCERSGTMEDAREMGEDAARELLARGGLRLIRGEG